MANYYYEINDSILENLSYYDCKYYAVSSSRYSDAMMAGGYKITQESDRIWKEDSNGVRFVKNRYMIDYDAVDMKEFMWVKLSSKQIN